MSLIRRARAVLPSLQARFLLIVGSVTLVLSLLVWGVFNSVVEHMVERVGVRFAEKQVLYDKSRTLQPLIREVALARQMADVAIIRQWAADEGNPRLKREALAELENRRRHFQDGSYFLALAGSGNYYYNNAAEEFTTQPLRYTLDAAKPVDAWFFATLKSPAAYHINVDPDVSLGVTKVWINVLLRDGDRVLGVLGTGIDLTRFIAEVVDVPQPGVTSLFIDQNAAIQIYRDINLIDFSSFTKSVDQQRSIDQLLRRPEDRTWVRAAITQLARGESNVASRFVHVEGKRYLAAMAALPEVGWYSVTLLDLGVLLPRKDFIAMGIAIGLAALGMLVMLTWLLRRQVIRPVASLSDAAERLRGGDFVLAPMEQTDSEVGQLTTRFIAMADAVGKNRHALENEIDKRMREIVDSKKMLEVALYQERESRQAQANLVAMMAHEIRNPMALIGASAQSLNILTTPEQADLKTRIEKILGAVRHVSRLMDNLLADERLSMASSGIARTAGDLNAFCAELAGTLTAFHGHPVCFEQGTDDARLWADWQLVAIAVGNLIDNAIKYTSPDSDIRVRVWQPEPVMMCVEVADDGPGIALDIQQRIFEKFARGHAGNSVPGSGLGLYLVEFIARLHGGHVELDSAPGAGSRFRIFLPVRG